MARYGTGTRAVSSLNQLKTAVISETVALARWIEQWPGVALIATGLGATQNFHHGLLPVISQLRLDSVNIWQQQLG